MQKEIKLSPSILSADFANLESELKVLEQSGVDRIHLDVMDGHFVPNLTFGPPVVKALRKKTGTRLLFETHLMISNPEKYVLPFKEAGSDIIIFHIETAQNPIRLIDQIESLDMKSGVCIKPNTNWEEIGGILHLVDMVLVMTVEPGFGGQEYLSSAAKKIQDLHNFILNQKLDIDIAVDGGINLETIKDATEKGANILVAGNAIYHDKKVLENIKALKSAAEKRS